MSSCYSDSVNSLTAALLISIRIQLILSSFKRPLYGSRNSRRGSRKVRVLLICASVCSDVLDVVNQQARQAVSRLPANVLPVSSLPPLNPVCGW